MKRGPRRHRQDVAASRGVMPKVGPNGLVAYFGMLADGLAAEWICAQRP